MAKITCIKYRRLVSFGDYSNAAVELEAMLTGNDDVDKVFVELAEKAEQLLSAVPLVYERKQLSRLVKAYEEELRKEISILKDYENKYREALAEVTRLREEIEKIMKEVEESKSRITAFLEKIREKMLRSS